MKSNFGSASTVEILLCKAVPRFEQGLMTWSAPERVASKTSDEVDPSADVAESPEGIARKDHANIFENLVDYKSILSQVAAIFDTI